MSNEWILLLAVIVLTAGTGVFVAAEFSLITVGRNDIDAEVEQGNPSARRIQAGLMSLSTQLSGAQVGITLTTLLVGFMTKGSVQVLVRDFLIFVGVSEGVTSAVEEPLAIFVVTAFSMILGELIPKNLAIAVPRATAAWAVPLQMAFTWVASPLIRLLNQSANRFLALFGIEATEELHSGRSPEELTALVRRSAEAGTLDAGTATLLTRSLGFREHTASDVMTPRVRMHVVNKQDSVKDLIAKSRETGLSRFPVTDRDMDDVIGVIHLKAVVQVPLEDRGEVSIGTLMSPPLTVPETLALPPLLAQLRSDSRQAAVVLDEFGGTAGIVTLEDLIEEIVGDVADEHDPQEARPKSLSLGRWSIPGITRIDEVNELTGLALEESPVYETIAGFMQYSLGAVGDVGDKVALESGTLRIARMEGHRIHRVDYLPAGSSAAGGDSR